MLLIAVGRLFFPSSSLSCGLWHRILQQLTGGYLCHSGSSFLGYFLFYVHSEVFFLCINLIFTFQLDLKGTVHHCTDLKFCLLYYDTHGSSRLSCSLIFYCILYSPSIYSVDKEVTREQCIYKGRTVWNIVTYFNCNKLAYVKLRVVVEVILILCVCYNSQRSENTLCAFILSCHADSGNQQVSSPP